LETCKNNSIVVDNPVEIKMDLRVPLQRENSEREVIIVITCFSNNANSKETAKICSPNIEVI